MQKNKLAFIGGSGIYNLDIFEKIAEHDIVSVFGKPSSKIIEGKINNNSIFFLSRHGIDHRISPSEINYRANIECLKQLENSNKHYDTVVIMRSDLWLEHDNWESFFNNNNDDRVYSNGPITEDNGHPFINDLFLMGNLSNIKKIIKYFEPKNLQLNHQTLAESILSNNLIRNPKDFIPKCLHKLEVAAR